MPPQSWSMINAVSGRLASAVKVAKMTSWRVFWCRGVAALLAALFVAQTAEAASKGEIPIPAATLALMAARDTAPTAPILMRAYKKESEIEVWKQNKSGRYVFLKSFPICRWSGTLGPKTAQGDRQTPEGFYSVGFDQLNPNSHYYLSFDIGYPNAYDKAHGGSGSAVMVHGTCSSAGCFAMTDNLVGEIFALAREALRGGQPAFQFQSYPFRMTAQNMARYRLDPNIAFWRQLKEGSDRFEATGEEVAFSVVDGRYAFAPSSDPALEALAKAREAREQARTAVFIRLGSAAVRTSYSDGGQNAYFAALLRKGAHLGDVSRPEALAFAGVDEVLSPAKGVCAKKGVCPDIFSKAPGQPQSKPAAEKPVDDKPAPGASRIILTATHAAAIPATAREALGPAPLCYKLGRPAPEQSVITGGMPVLPAVWFD
jgi:murein L,D-transpeptidase YafK